MPRPRNSGVWSISNPRLASLTACWRRKRWQCSSLQHGFIPNKPADQPTSPSPIRSAIPVPIPGQMRSAIPVPVGWVRPATVVATVTATVVATVTTAVVATVITVPSVVISRVAVNDIVLIGIWIWRRVVRLIALDDDDCLCLCGCGYSEDSSTQHRTSRERRENYLFHFDTHLSCLNAAAHFNTSPNQNQRRIEQEFVNQHG